MQVSLGPILHQAEAADPSRRQFGWIPTMCRVYTGSPMSEGICERVHSAGSDVLDEGNTLLNDQIFEQIAVLRMNRDIKEKWRKKYEICLNKTTF